MLEHVAFSILSLAVSPTTSADPRALDYGPHAVGFRSTLETDRSRMARARTTFDGKAIAGDPALFLQVSVWYPAEASEDAPRLTTNDYKLLSRSPLLDEDALIGDWGRTLRFAGVDAAESDLRTALRTSRRGVRDAPPRPGKFPVILGGLESPASSATLGEYLASHGYVVITTPSQSRTATQQATAPLVAIETQARNLEYLLAFAHGLPFADDSRVGIIGVNFDGMAALTFQMRNQRADAIVSVDGWEGKAGGVSTLSRSPFFQPTQMRVPYLVFEQDESPVPPSLAHDRTIWNSLKYSDRQWYVLSGFGHVFLTTDQFTAPGLKAAVVENYRFLYGTIREFFDRHLRRTRPAAAPAVPTIKERLSEPPLAPAPTTEEFEQIVMNESVERATEVFRRARRDNPDLVVADEGTLNLYAFRFEQRKKTAETLALRALAAEAFPTSARATYNLGLAHANAGEAKSALDAFTRALTLLDNDARLSEAEKQRLRDDLRQRVGG